MRSYIDLAIDLICDLIDDKIHLMFITYHWTNVKPQGSSLAESNCLHASYEEGLHQQSLESKNMMWGYWVTSPGHNYRFSSQRRTNLLSHQRRRFADIMFKFGGTGGNRTPVLRAKNTVLKPTFVTIPNKAVPAGFEPTTSAFQ